MTSMPSGVVQITGPYMTSSGTTGPFTFSCWIGGEKFSGSGQTPQEASDDLANATSGRVVVVVNDLGTKKLLRGIQNDLPRAIERILLDESSIKSPRKQSPSYPGSGHYGSKRKKGKF